LTGSIFQFSYYYLGLLLAFVGLVGWFWPRKSAEAEL
jgi:hypothetical protein